MSSVFLQSKARRKTTRTVSFTSGKGGVGKTVLLSNVAVHMARQGKKVLILDGDFAMANVDIVFGKRASGSIHDVITNRKTINEVLMEVHPNIFLIPGGSGIYELQYLNKFQRRNIIDQMSQLQYEFDYMLIDTAPGIDDNVLHLNSAAQEICVVVTPDPTSLTDAYALIKVQNQKYKGRHFSIISNQVRNEAEGLAVFKRLSDVSSRFLDVGLDYKGFVPYDPDLSRALRGQQLVALSNMFAPSNRPIMRISESLGAMDVMEEPTGNIQFYWQQILEMA